MGKETISSQELADYTHINSTQIRRDLSGFGKFGSGVGYQMESLVSRDQEDHPHRDQHNIALFGAGNSARRLPARTSSPTTGFRSSPFSTSTRTRSEAT